MPDQEPLPPYTDEELASLVPHDSDSIWRAAMNPYRREAVCIRERRLLATIDQLKEENRILKNHSVLIGDDSMLLNGKYAAQWRAYEKEFPVLIAERDRYKAALEEIVEMSVCWCVNIWTERDMHSPNCPADIHEFAYDAIHPEPTSSP